MDVDSISPIQRCIDTAILMQAGAASLNVSHQSLLVEPGSLVVDHEEVSKVFKQIGALSLSIVLEKNHGMCFSLDFNVPWIEDWSFFPLDISLQTAI